MISSVLTPFPSILVAPQYFW